MNRAQLCHCCKEISLITRRLFLYSGCFVCCLRPVFCSLFMVWLIEASSRLKWVSLSLSQDSWEYGEHLTLLKRQCHTIHLPQFITGLLGIWGTFNTVKETVSHYTSPSVYHRTPGNMGNI